MHLLWQTHVANKPDTTMAFTFRTTLLQVRLSSKVDKNRSDGHLLSVHAKTSRQKNWNSHRDSVIRLSFLPTICRKAAKDDLSQQGSMT